MTNRYIQPYRKLTRYIITIIFFAVPFITIGGNSAFRFDIPSLNLYFFGSVISIENFFVVLLILFVITFAFIVMTQVLGRIWCGWLCPQTVITELTWFMQQIRYAKAVKKAIYHASVFVFSLAVSTCLVWYFVSPYDFFSDLAKMSTGPVVNGFIIVLTIITYLNFGFMRQKFCKFICPYSKFQSVMFDKNTLVVQMIPETRDDCLQCSACVNTCPTDIDIRKGLDSACIACARCVDACRGVFNRDDKYSLIDYIFGDSNKVNFLRPNVLITSLIFVIFLGLTVFQIASTKAYEFEVFPNQQFMPRYIDNDIVNSYEVKVSNKTSKTLKVTFLLDGYKEYSIAPEAQLQVDANDSKKQIIYLKLPAKLFDKKAILGLKMKSVADNKDKTENIAELSFRRPLRRK